VVGATSSEGFSSLCLFLSVSVCCSTVYCVRWDKCTTIIYENQFCRHLRSTEQSVELISVVKSRLGCTAGTQTRRFWSSGCWIHTTSLADSWRCGLTRFLIARQLLFCVRWTSLKKGWNRSREKNDVMMWRVTCHVTPVIKRSSKFLSLHRTVQFYK